MFHTDQPVKTGAMYVPENIEVVDLPGRRLLSAGIVTGLKLGDFRPRLIDIGNEISLRDLLMVNIE